ncbi:MAG: ATP-binding cassette domain-containing protein, partial [Pseudomonadota bacterium]
EQTSARLDQVGMAGLADRPYGALSTGQQRRCLLARALVTGAGHLVLDEPLAGLDPGAAYRLLALLGELMDGGVHIVLATHHVHEILPQVEHVVLLQDGAVVGAGQRRKWLTDQTISELYGLKLRLVTAGDYQFALPA